jgi:hypothetical protein
MENRMVSRLTSFVLPVAMAVSLAGFSGCAGSKSSSSSKSGSSSAEEQKNQKVEEARRSAEDAEMKAHQLREDKNRNQTKTSSN